jgi:hypothetical protein
MGGGIDEGISQDMKAIAAAVEGCSVYTTGTSRAFLYGSMDNDVTVVYIKAPDWWPEPMPEGHCSKLLKSIYGIPPAASRWHKHISAWMEANDYLTIKGK